MKIIRTGKKIAFLDVSVGSPFYAHGRYWVRRTFEAACELRSTRDGLLARAANFVIEGTTRPERAKSGLFYSHPGETCEEVESVEVAE
jgi:hypothetical protein